MHRPDETRFLLTQANQRQVVRRLCQRQPRRLVFRHKLGHLAGLVGGVQVSPIQQLSAGSRLLEDDLQRPFPTIPHKNRAQNGMPRRDLLPRLQQQLRLQGAFNGEGRLLKIDVILRMQQRVEQDALLQR